MAELVQCRRKPPVLVPLPNPLRLPPDRLRQRLQLLVNYAERYRELDEVEAREYLNLKHILAHGCEKPKGQWFPGMQKKKFAPDEIKKALRLLD